MEIGVVNFDIGSIIQFRTRNQYDQNIYQGTVTGFIRSTLAQKLNRDIAVYHLNVSKTFTELTDMADQEFFTLTSASEEEVPFAKDWIDPATMVLVSVVDYRDFRIYVLDADVPTVQNLLTIHNIRHKLL